MKKLTILETSIVGFFVGVVVSAYITFLMSNGSFVGYILNWVSLHPVLDKFDIPESQFLVTSFLFFVAVYTFYGAVIGFIIKKLSRPTFIVVPVIFIIACLAFLEQYSGSKNFVVADETFSQTATVIKSRPVDNTPKQYFGKEALGDLNGDNKDDVAFLIERNDDSRGTLFYLSSALTTENGKQGTNLIFLGDRVVPVGIFIKENTINVEYKTPELEDIQYLYARLNSDGVLEKVAM